MEMQEVSEVETREADGAAEKMSHVLDYVIYVCEAAGAGRDVRSDFAGVQFVEIQCHMV